MITGVPTQIRRHRSDSRQSARADGRHLFHAHRISHVGAGMPRVSMPPVLQLPQTHSFYATCCHLLLAQFLSQITTEYQRGALCWHCLTQYQTSELHVIVCAAGDRYFLRRHRYLQSGGECFPRTGAFERMRSHACNVTPHYVHEFIAWILNLWQMDELNRFMSAEDLPLEMQTRLREYFRQTKHLRFSDMRRRLLSQMPPNLKAEVRPSRCARVFFYFPPSCMCVGAVGQRSMACGRLVTVVRTDSA